MVPDRSASSVNAARLRHLEAAYSHVPQNIRSSGSLNLEFGVREGLSINHLANLTRSAGLMWDGFDSFQGLPGSSVASKHWRARAFTTHGRMPHVFDNVRLHAGWFNNTLPPFLDSPLATGRHAAFLHLDADIFESTWTVLDAVCARCLLRVGTVLAFDELAGKRSIGQRQLEHEWRALRLAAAKYKFDFRFITWMMHKVSPYIRVAVQITRIGASPSCPAIAGPEGRMLARASTGMKPRMVGPVQVACKRRS